MIITALRAYNVLKYTQLQLDNLPEKGIIAISGHNESGKSSIGEILCFALFGRTFSLKPEYMKKIIRWGEDNCSVSLNFRVEDQEYNLFRFLEENGTHAAKLSLVGFEDTPLARSPEQVDEVVTNILGYNFEEFIESFYLAQREITSPHPHGKAVKSIAGMDALEQVTSAYEQDANAHKAQLRILSVEQASLQDELEELALEEGHLEALKDERYKLDVDLETARSLGTYLKNAADTYIANEDRIRQAGKKRGRARFLRLLSLLLALAGGGAWGLLIHGSELPFSVQLLESVQQHVPGWQESYINVIGIAGAVFAVLFLIYWQRSSSHNRRVGAMRAESAKLAGIMDQVRSVTVYELVTDASGSEDDEDRQAEVLHSDAAERYSADKYEHLQSQVISVKAPASDVADYNEIEQRWLAEQISLRKLTLGHIGDEINEETDRVNLAEQLHSEIASLQSSIDELSTQLDKWQKAIELLAGASKHFSSKFNRDIRDLMARNLPVFTQGRYDHLQIQPGLGVRLFSNDKHDFLDMDEISSGTQRQIMLALRLAMAQKLMGQTVKGRQFAFLDEPFAFFDEERTRHALQALDELSDAISQIWIVSQTFPDGHEFAAEIKCSRELDKFSMAAKTDSSPVDRANNIKPDVIEELADTTD